MFLDLVPLFLLFAHSDSILFINFLLFLKSARDLEVGNLVGNFDVEELFVSPLLNRVPVLFHEVDLPLFKLVNLLVLDKRPGLGGR